MGAVLEMTTDDDADDNDDCIELYKISFLG